MITIQSPPYSFSIIHRFMCIVSLSLIPDVVDDIVYLGWLLPQSLRRLSALAYRQAFLHLRSQITLAWPVHTRPRLIRLPRHLLYYSTLRLLANTRTSYQSILQSQSQQHPIAPVEWYPRSLKPSISDLR